MATVALFLALGGGAYAVTRLPAHSVGSKQLKKGAVTPGKVAKSTARIFRGKTGARRPQGLVGPQGTQGLMGAQGDDGTPGRDGVAVAVRARSTGPAVHTPDDHSFVSVPLASNTWTQAPTEVDLGFYGAITVTPPSTSTCSPTAHLNVVIEIDGNTVDTESKGFIVGEATRVRLLGPTASLFEPGSAQAHTVTARVSSICDSGDFPVDFTITDLRLDLIRAL